jgi:hypothetical protein
MTAGPIHAVAVKHAPRADAASSGALRGVARRLAREPLLHFFAVGLVLFAAAERHRTQADLYRIVVTPERVRQLVEAYRAEFGTAPGPKTLAGLVDHDVDEEALYREGLARKLDQDDEIVRRRIVQKMQFLEQDLSAPAEPSAAELAAWFRTHRGDYVQPASLSFSHIYFSDVHGGSDAARARALSTLARLSDTTQRAPERGDPFPDLYDYAGFGPEQAKRLFGDSEISRKLFQAPQGRWIGPLRSGYGWHLVRVQSVQPARSLDFDEARERVRADVLAAEQEAANQRAFAALKARFTVVRQDQGAAR